MLWPAKHKREIAVATYGVAGSAGSPSVSSRWCDDADALHAAVLAGISLIVIPGRARGTAEIDRATARFPEKGIAFVRVGGKLSPTEAIGSFAPSAKRASLCTSLNITARGATATSKDEDASGVATAQAHLAELCLGHDGLQDVVRALAEDGAGARRWVVAVDGAHTLAPAILSSLKLLAGARVPGAPRIQIVFAGGAQFYLGLAEERFRTIREAVRQETEANRFAPARLLRLPQEHGSSVAAMALVAVAVGTGVPFWVNMLSGTCISAGTFATPACSSPRLPAPIAEASLLVEEVAAAPAGWSGNAAAWRARKQRKDDAYMTRQAAAPRSPAQVEQVRRATNPPARPLPLAPAPVRTLTNG